jgi:phosphate transport system substrate-binding protein
MRLQFGVLVGICAFSLGCFGDARDFGEVLEGMSGGSNDDDDDTDDDATPLVVEGSDAMGPILSIVAPDFTDESGIEVDVNITDSLVTVTGVGEGRSDLGAISRDLTEVEIDRYPEIVATPYALDGIAVVVNVDNPLSALSIEQLADIYSGRAITWTNVGGDDVSVVAYSRPFGSEINRTFAEAVLGETPLREDAEIVDSNGQMQSGVSGNEGGIAYLGVGFVDDSVKVVTVEGVVPDTGTIQGGTYPITRNFFLLLGDATNRTEDAQAFIDFAAGAMGDDAILENGYLPVP